MRITPLILLCALCACAERTAAPKPNKEAGVPAFQRVDQPDFPMREGATVRRATPPTEEELRLIEAAVKGLPPDAAAALREALLDSTGSYRVSSAGSPEHQAAIARVYEARRRAFHLPARRALIPVTIALVPDLPTERATAEIIRNIARPDDQDVILLRERELDEGRVASAVFALLKDRDVNGLAPRIYRHFMIGFAKPPVQMPNGIFDAPGTVNRLREAMARPVAGVGTVKAVTVNLPPVKF